ncbi:Serralysin precursor [Hartmannibacter diazotrophicus]|uniref:Serralysin n=1 Tax=Hartmannibacter diazotrophicus TaxID=1482074 RepID=A0A2C9DDW7_9HYPH|nr:M10 family metallopeptidase C-terminal domain-containing protein [Hartmannibacter diazotrophicus]SON58359.1 Serralysin precursor [Hartmannibacter diazotrophicus]
MTEEAAIAGAGVSSTTSASLPTYSYGQIADYLQNGYWTSNSGYAHHYNVAPGGSISVNISGLTSASQTLAVNALSAWTMVSGINFNVVTSGAQITFSDSNASGAYTNTWYTYSASGPGYGTTTSSTVNISTSWVATYGTTLDSYSFQTYIHEIGHALGLGHGGHYNSSATYGVDNHYLNDSWQASVMSYFSQYENTNVNASYAYVVTPMIADIIAIQNMYGTATNLRTGNTVYGEHSTAGGYYDQISSASPVTFTILDNGGVDTIDFGSQTANQVINLNAETISSVMGLTGNMIIARGTVIENAVSGSGNDTILGNSAGNTIYGGGGADQITGNGGNDNIFGGNGTDTANFNVNLAAATIYYFGSTHDVVLRNGTDGSDQLHSVESLHFLDQTVSVSSLADHGSILEYGASYADLRVTYGTNQSALMAHLQNQGIAEGRSISFDARFYLGSYADLRNAFGTDRAAAATHFIKHGAAEGRTDAAFDDLEYVASYSDLINAFGTNAAAGHRHFLNHGFAEGRGDNFDGRLYIGAYADLRAAFGADRDAGTRHFIKRGASEGRTDAAFDDLEYVASYSDLINAFGTNAAAGHRHFLKHGFSEGRGDNFDGLKYTASYGDLIQVFGTNHDASTMHYIRHGHDEGRTTTFDPSAYLAAAGNSDLVAAFGSNLTAATMHYIEHGYAEGRHTA